MPTISRLQFVFTLAWLVVFFSLIYPVFSPSLGAVIAFLGTYLGLIGIRWLEKRRSGANG